MDPIITKVSDTQIEIRKTIPEQDIPERVDTAVVTLNDLQDKKTQLEAQLAQEIEYKKTPQAELDKIDADIARIQAQINETQGYIDTAIQQGVVEEVTPE